MENIQKYLEVSPYSEWNIAVESVKFHFIFGNYTLPLLRGVGGGMLSNKRHDVMPPNSQPVQSAMDRQAYIHLGIHDCTLRSAFYIVVT